MLSGGPLRELSELGNWFWRSRTSFNTFGLMIKRPHILVLCGRNKKRSRTAEHIFKNDDRFDIRSAGVSPKAEKVVTEKDVAWADVIFVMMPDQRSRLQQQFTHLPLPAIEVLHIEDDYEFLNEELVDLLQDKINQSLKRNYNI
jgi:protein-tyrosine phosphatase